MTPPVDNPPPPQHCTVCGYPRYFMRYREKMGKDGRMARWPEYEICPNRDDPNLHPNSRTAKELQAVAQYSPEVARVVTSIRLPEGRLYRMNNRYDPLEEAADALTHFIETYERLPIAIAVHPFQLTCETLDVEWEGKEETIPIWPLRTITPGYGYLFLVLKLQGGQDGRNGYA